MPCGWLSAADLNAWRVRYDLAKPQPFAPLPELQGWQRCYSSDLQRSLLTAEAIYSGEVLHTPLLREPDIAPFQTGRLQLPVSIWKWVLRAVWFTGHSSQRSARNDFLHRVKTVADLAESSTVDILLVSHAGMMAYLRKELLQRGFQGPKFRIAEHAKLYVFERT